MFVSKGVLFPQRPYILRVMILTTSGPIWSYQPVETPCLMEGPIRTPPSPRHFLKGFGWYGNLLMTIVRVLRSTLLRFSVASYLLGYLQSSREGYDPEGTTIYPVVCSISLVPSRVYVSDGRSDGREIHWDRYKVWCS